MIEKVARDLQLSSAGVPDPSRPSAQGNAAARETYPEGSRSTVESSSGNDAFPPWPRGAPGNQ
jgi:hypothetical protein